MPRSKYIGTKWWDGSNLWVVYSVTRDAFTFFSPFGEGGTRFPLRTHIVVKRAELKTWEQLPIPDSWATWQYCHFVLRDDPGTPPRLIAQIDSVTSRSVTVRTRFLSGLSRTEPLTWPQFLLWFTEATQDQFRLFHIAEEPNEAQSAIEPWDDAQGPTDPSPAELKPTTPVDPEFDWSTF